MVNDLMLGSRLNVPTRFSCFSAGVLIVPTSHDTISGCLVVRFGGDLYSAQVSFIRVCAATTTAHSASVSDLPTGQVSADGLAYSLSGCSLRGTAAASRLPPSLLVMKTMSIYTSMVLNITRTTFILDEVSLAVS